MGCDMHIEAHKVNADLSYDVLNFNPFQSRSYSRSAFLAGVRNSYGVVPLSLPRGLPLHIQKEDSCRIHDEERTGFTTFDEHRYLMERRFGEYSRSWLTIKEICDYDYNVVFEETTEEGELVKKRVISYRDFLGENFFKELKILQELAADMIVFGFSG